MAAQPVNVRIDKTELDKVAARVAELRGLVVTVGIHGDEGDHEGDGLTVAQLAAIHEFGIGVVPERSFLRSTVRAERRKIAKNMALAAERVIEGKLTPKKALGLVGEDLVGKIKSRIVNRQIPQDLADATIKRKERSNVRSGFGTGALIDTGQLLNSITQKVGRG